MNSWKIRFIFDDPRLNRTIAGYGRTRLTSSYLSTMCGHLPEILSKRERIERIERERIERIERERIERDVRKYMAEKQQNEC